MCNSYRYSIVTLILPLFFLSACGYFSDAKKPLPNDVLIGGLHRGQPLFIYSYVQDFAKRFGLPEDKAIQLDTGLSAIAVEVRPEIGQIDCYIHLYLDDTVSVYVPQNRKSITAQGVEERIFAKTFNDVDIDWRISLINIMNMVYRTKGGGGLLDTPNYTQVKPNFLPNLNLVSMKIACIFLDISHGPTEIIIQKAGTSDYQIGFEDENNMYNDNTYAFSLPPTLHRHLQPYIEYTNKFHVMKNSNMMPSGGFQDATIEIP